MVTLLQQYASIHPSVPDALYRLLMRQDDVSYLRQEDGIIGFEVDLSSNAHLSGFALIAIRKQTILVYRKERGRQLILFPSMDKLLNDEFGLRQLPVSKCLYTDASFNGQLIAKGKLADMVRDLTPPLRDAVIEDDILEKMNKALEKSRYALEEIESKVQVLDEMESKIINSQESDFDAPDFDEPNFDEPDFDEPNFDEPNFDEAEIDDTTRTPGEIIAGNTYETAYQLLDDAVMLGANRERLLNLLNAVLNKASDMDQSVVLKAYHQLVVRLFNEGKAS